MGALEWTLEWRESSKRMEAEIRLIGLTVRVQHSRLSHVCSSYLQQKCEDIPGLEQRQVLSQAFYTSSKMTHPYLSYAIMLSTNEDAFMVNIIIIKGPIQGYVVL